MGMAGGEGQKGALSQRGLEATGTQYLQGQQRTKFSPSGAVAGVMMSHLAAPDILVERFLEPLRRCRRFSPGINELCDFGGKYTPWASVYASAVRGRIF